MIRESYEALQILMDRHGAVWSLIETVWCLMELYGALWNLLDLQGVL